MNPTRVESFLDFYRDVYKMLFKLQETLRKTVLGGTVRRGLHPVNESSIPYYIPHYEGFKKLGQQV